MYVCMLGCDKVRNSIFQASFIATVKPSNSQAMFSLSIEFNFIVVNIELIIPKRTTSLFIAKIAHGIFGFIEHENSGIHNAYETPSGQICSMCIQKCGTSQNAM